MLAFSLLVVLTRLNVTDDGLLQLGPSKKAFNSMVCGMNFRMPSNALACKEYDFEKGHYFFERNTVENRSPSIYLTSS